jgi:hypothetical protein
MSYRRRRSVSHAQTMGGKNVPTKFNHKATTSYPNAYSVFCAGERAAQTAYSESLAHLAKIYSQLKEEARLGKQDRGSKGRNQLWERYCKAKKGLRGIKHERVLILKTAFYLQTGIEL